MLIFYMGQRYSFYFNISSVSLIFSAKIYVTITCHFYMKLFFVIVKLYSLLYRFLECISIRRCKIYYVRIYSFFLKTGHNDRFLFLVFSLH